MISIPGIELLTFAIMAGIAAAADPRQPLADRCWCLLPWCSLLPARKARCRSSPISITSILSAADSSQARFLRRIPDDCLTLVAVPSLLLNEKQVRTLVDDLEVRYLGQSRSQHALRAAHRPPGRARASQENDPWSNCARS